MSKVATVGMKDQEFNALVDDEFGEPRAPKARGGQRVWVAPDSLIRELETEGADPRLSKSAARFRGVLGRMIGKKPAALTDEGANRLMKMDNAMREIAKANGIKLRD